MSGRCLDIGSGSCDVVADFILPKLNPEASIVCSDISESIVNFGKEKYGSNHRISFLKLDIETSELPDDLKEQFDHVTSFYCLHWCHNMRQVFENILDLLRPGGTILSFFTANSPARNAYQTMAAMPLYQPHMEDADRHIPSYYNSENPYETMKALFTDVGFVVCHFSSREKNYVYKNLAFMKDSLLAVNPFIDRMPEDLKVEYEKDLLKEFERQCIILNKNRNNENEYNILTKYHIFIAYLKKPLAK